MEIEAARQELQNTFGSGRDWEIRLRSWGAPYCICVHVTNAKLQEKFTGGTIDEVMDQVRKWIEESGRRRKG